ncbi:hypothetical protein AB0J83_45230 [Actinoplanes sp. NPDC049596]|uniref:hypothetical protein n=1 Tax=unclassified Actinoplanes TaxID=2626549 RepID=UPI003447C448
MRQAFVHRAGHCTFTTGEMLAALRSLERRVATGRWPDTSPRALNTLATSVDTPVHVNYTPALHREAEV